MVAQQHGVLVAEVGHQPLALLQVGGDALVFVEGQVVAGDHAGLGVGQQPLAHGRDRLAVGRVQVNHRLGVLARHVHGRVDGEARGVDDVGRLAHRQALDVDLHQRGGGDLLEHHLVRVDQEVVLGPGHARRQVGEDQVVPAIQGHQAERRRQVHPQIPLLLGHGLRLFSNRLQHIDPPQWFLWFDQGLARTGGYDCPEVYTRESRFEAAGLKTSGLRAAGARPGSAPAP